ETAMLGQKAFIFISLLTTINARTHKDPALHPKWSLFDDEVCGTREIDRIIGGKDAELGSFPWIVRIGYITPNSTKEPMFRCGAVLVSKLYVVSAAHCVTNLPFHLTVGAIRLGEHNTMTDPDCENDVCADPVQDYRPAQIIAHDNYGNPSFKNDISLIRLDRPVKFTDYVKPICMIRGEQMDKQYIGETSEVAGWGIYDIENPKPSVILQTIKLPIVENEKCVDAFKKHADIGPTQMCVGGMIGEDSCGGDSGGPLMKVDVVGRKEPRYYLIGIVSFGAKRCGASTMPGVYTRIANYMNWIMDHMHP
ncbi:hypothetical protein L9F63_012678, partial [Diploptera punctata]